MGLSAHLDASAVIGIINDRHEYRNRLDRLRLAGSQLFVSSIVMFEIRYGIANSNRFEKNNAKLQAFLPTIDGILPFTDEEARAAGEIRATLRKAGTPIGPYDLLIAGHAVRAAATLVTANASEFKRVPGLTILDWTK